MPFYDNVAQVVARVVLWNMSRLVGITSSRKRCSRRDDCSTSQVRCGDVYTAVTAWLNEVPRGPLTFGLLVMLGMVYSVHWPYLTESPDSGFSAVSALMAPLYARRITRPTRSVQGLGKTLQTISLVAYLCEYRGINGPHIVITPKSTLGNWVNEFRRFCPIVRVTKFHGNNEERVGARSGVRQWRMATNDLCTNGGV